MVQDGPSPEPLLGDDEFLRRHLPGDSEAARELRRRIAMLNLGQNPSLIRVIHLKGETGSGKNYVAGVIAAHRRWLSVKNTEAEMGLDVPVGTLHDQYHDILLTALPDTLIESELFGHKKGAFSGALCDKDGLLAADGSQDILLDEIGDASLAIQVKLLAVIEGREFLPIGGALSRGKKTGDERQCHARLLVATNRPLKALVLEGRFREDLYWRINEYPLHVPALRDQRDTIVAIIGKIISDLGESWQDDPLAKTPMSCLTTEDLSWAKQHAWPGNIRQLKNGLKVWMLERGRRPFKEIVEAIERELGASEAVSDQGIISGLVRAGLDAVLSSNVPSPKTLAGFVEGHRRMTIKGLLGWVEASNPTSDQLRRMFPGHKTVESIRNKLSQWKREMR